MMTDHFIREHPAKLRKASSPRSCRIVFCRHWSTHIVKLAPCGNDDSSCSREDCHCLAFFFQTSAIYSLGIVFWNTIKKKYGSHRHDEKMEGENICCCVTALRCVCVFSQQNVVFIQREQNGPNYCCFSFSSRIPHVHWTVPTSDAMYLRDARNIAASDKPRALCVDKQSVEFGPCASSWSEVDKKENSMEDIGATSFQPIKVISHVSKSNPSSLTSSY